jgi:hypothetical protein
MALGLDPWVDAGSPQENASKQESRAEAGKIHSKRAIFVPAMLQTR